MPDNIGLEETARAVAGHYALRLFLNYGEDRGRAVLRGMLAGVVAGSAAVLGWEETRKLVDELDTRAHLPPPGSRPKLAVVNDRVTA